MSWEPRKKKSAGELLGAGFSAITSVGVDKLTVTELTQISGVSRPTFYTYFGDVNGYLAEMWLHYGMAWLNFQLGEKLPDELKLTETEVDTFDLAMLEIFVAARRIPEVREVIEPDLQNWWKLQTEHKSARELNLSWKFAVIIGAKLSRAVSMKSKLALPFVETFDLEDDWESSPRFAKLKGTQKVEFELSGLEVTGEDLESHLTAAAISIIASSGAANASITRVARRARVSTGSVYPRFKNIDVLIESSFDKVMQKLIAANIELAKAKGRSLESYGTFVNAGLLPGRKVWRNYRSEMHLEAIHNPRVAELMNLAFTKTSEQLRVDIAKVHVPSSLAEAAAWLMHDQALGISVLFGLLPRIGDLDHRVMLLHLEKHLRKAA